MDAFVDHVTFDNAPHITNASGGFAVTAQTGFHTGVLQSIADVVDRCGIMLDPVVYSSGNWINP